MTTNSQNPSRVLRLDIQALRAFSIIAVVVFHSFPTLMPGGFLGVDVFFVISGFLMYDVLLRMRAKSLRIAREFWVRRVRRLFPAAATVIVFTFLAARAVLPETRWIEAAQEAIASLFFSVNWLFVSASVDYLQNENRPSPFQHYWSLSVEEQYYIALPLLLIFGTFAARKSQISFEIIGKLVVSGIFALSLTFSVYFTNRDSAEAYFHTGTRLWELALGGIVAAWQPVLSPLLNRAPGFTRFMSYGLIGASFWAFNGTTPIPGVAALLPVIGAGLFLAQTSQAHPFRRIEENSATQFIGEYSYSIYLVHWPVLILATEANAFFTQPLGIGALVAATVGIAWAMKRLVEDPVRYGAFFKPTSRLIGVAVAATLVVSGLAVSQIAVIVNLEATVLANRVTISSVAQQLDSKCFGAQAMSNKPCDATIKSLANLQPDPLIAKDDLSVAYADNCFTYRPFTDFQTCYYGRGERLLVIVGNSHAGQWLEPIIYAAEQNNAKVVTLFASQCNASDANLDFGNENFTKACRNYGEWVQQQVLDLNPDLVILSQRQSIPLQGHSLIGSSSAAVEGYGTYLRRMVKNSPILVIKDPVNPPPEYGLVPECLQKHFPDVASCEWSQFHEFWQDPLWVAANEIGGTSVSVLSLERYMCRSGTCLPVIGGVVVYRDNTHVTNTFALSLGPQFSEALKSALERNR